MRRFGGREIRIFAGFSEILGLESLSLPDSGYDMLTILQNIRCFAPEDLGVRDIFLAGERIYRITPPGRCLWPKGEARVISGEGLIALPGFIDGHVHLIGGGGEEGFCSRIGEISGEEILSAGVTTVVGLLGADSRTKSLYALFAKAKALEGEGLTTYLYSGSYSMPPVTLTGEVGKDLLLIDKVVGVGEIAVSDHRSSHPGFEDLLELASEIHLSAMLAGKPGLLHFHLGDGKQGLALVSRLLAESDLPPRVLLPTHLNRSPTLLNQAVEYVKAGGYIDLTSGEQEGVDLPEAVELLMQSGIPMERVTVSSDANGSIPCGGVGKIRTLFDDIIRCITDKKLDTETVFSLVSKNPARALKIYPRKGALRAGSYGDILILDRQYRLCMLFAKGELKIDKRGGRNE